MNARQLYQLFLTHMAPRSRHVWLGGDRAHVELRQVDGQDFAVLGSKLTEEARRLPDVLWAEVHGATGRAVVCFRPGAASSEAAQLLVAQAELLAGVQGAEFGPRLHPADPNRAEAVLLELTAEVLGLVVGALLSVSPLPRSRLGGTVASVLAVLRAVPRLRRGLDNKWGADRVDVVLGVVSSALLGPAQRPLQALVGALESLALGAELASRQKVWGLREAELSSLPRSPAVPVRAPRPVAIPPGPIEEYADRAWAVALGGFAVSFLSTRSVERAFGALFGGIPRPARLGREVYSSFVGRQLASRRLLVMDDGALRRLDRVDCLVIEGSVLPESAIAFGGVATAPGRSRDSWLAIARELVDPRAPLALRKKGRVTVGPLGLLGVQPRGVFEEEVTLLGQGGELLLGVREADELVLVVELRVGSRLGLEELVVAAQEAGMHVVLASTDPDILQTVTADETFGPGEELARGVRKLQREGRVVCVVTQGESPALEVADVGIGLVSAERSAPWGAHIIAKDDLEDVRFLIEAAKSARLASRQSVNVALGAATLGAFASVGARLPVSTQRVLAIVNLASLVAMANGLRLNTDLSRLQLPPPRDPTPWHALDAGAALRRLGTTKEGLGKEDLARRRRPSRKSTPWSELVGHVSEELWNPLVPLLAAGAGLSAVVGSLTDAVTVFGVIGLNAGVGGVQRYRTERAISKLGQEHASPSWVERREGREKVSSDALVRGDIVLLAPGDYVAADCRILEAEGLEVDAAGLTGESLPVAKSAAPSFEENIADRTSMLYAGTWVTHGTARAVVVATGSATEARRGAAVFRPGVRETGVEKRMRELMDLTAPIAIAAGVGVIGTGILRGRKPEELVASAVSLAVASVPEGLPLLATAAQLAAAARLAKKGILVRNVRALEPLGRVDTVCFDKTGTVTAGSMELTETFGESPETLLGVAVLAGPPKALGQTHPDPIDRAIDAAAWAEAGAGAFEQLFVRRGDVPFQAGRAYAGSHGELDGAQVLFVKGAPEVLFAAASPGDRLEVLQRKAEEMAGRGLRVLAVGRAPLPEVPARWESLPTLEIVGLLAFKDPVRPTAKSALAGLRRAGLRAVLITGDHPLTGRSVAVELGISSEPYVVTGAELGVMTEDELTVRAPHVDVFARVSPSQKVRIVRALTRAGRHVAMVGDGANDAPAIRVAPVGIAMGDKASEAAHHAADLVLREAQVEKLVHAIVEGRALWTSVRDAIAILVGGNLGEIGFTLGAGLISGRPPLSPRQLLLVNLFTDVAPATALAMRAPNEMSFEQLRAAGPDQSLGFQLSRAIAGRATTTALGAGGAWVASSILGDRKGASTAALLALVATQLGQTLTSGEVSREVAITNIVTAAALGLLVQTPGLSGIFGCRPLGPIGLSIALGSSATAVLGSKFVPSLLGDWFPEQQEQAVPGPFADLMDRTGRAAEEISAALAETSLDV